MLLALDPASKCGWAWLDEAGTVADSGVWILRTKEFASDADAQWELFLRMQLLHKERPFCYAAYETAEAHRGTRAAVLAGGWAATIELFCRIQNVKSITVGWHDLKGFIFGKKGGKGTGKPEVTKRARVRWEGLITIVDNNHADALFLGLAAYKQLQGR